jgi:Hydroxymethylpyrimidine/phosphomethylpyrimidine kinase
MTAPPCVLCLSGLDPSGGAGIAADIQACAGSGVHALPLITVLTAQDSTNVAACWPVAQDVLEAQWDLLLADLRPSVVKIGLLGDAAQVRWLAPRLRALGRPVVLDPVLRAGGGRELVDSALREALCEALLPTVDWLLPNAAEARRLSDCEDLDAAAAALLARGVRNLLISGGDEPGDVVTDVWYRADTPTRRYTRPRLPGGLPRRRLHAGREPGRAAGARRRRHPRRATGPATHRTRAGRKLQPRSRSRFSPPSV